MDFWSRLIGGVSTPKKQAAPNPQQRLARFKKVYNHILQVWHKAPAFSSDPIAAENIRISLNRLTSILTDESRSPAPHLCLSFSASSQLYTAVSRIASSAKNEGVVREAVAFFAALLDSEEEDFIENEIFARSLMNFISRIATSGSVIIGEDIEAEIVELLFGIAAKIRLQPEILPVWFTTKDKGDGDTDSIQSKNDFAGITQKDDFPLCYQLIDHVHHEGRIGDFARTGLLYIFESASKSRELERWIVESDLSTLMASSLGALYSQLSRKLSILHPKTDLPIVLSLSDYIDLEPSTQAESMWSPDFKLHMDTFMSFLTFWQDVLEHCRSIDVRQTLIDHFQILFLQQLLYPSLLESSDKDGGSSVAVLTYVRLILDALDHPELVHMILYYLLALQEPFDAKAKTPKTPLAAKRRMSLVALSQPANEDDRMNPSLFNLVDLLLTSTRSQNPQTLVAALKLISVILSKNHHYAVGTLVKIIEVHVPDPHRTVGALNAEMEAYLAVAVACGGEAGVDAAYAAHLKDMQNLLESHPCSLRKISLDKATPITDHLSVTVPPQVQLHHLVAGDPLLTSLLNLLDQFLINDVETNLSLTEAITGLCACAQLRLENWITVDPSKYTFSEEIPLDCDTDTDTALHNIYLARQTPSYDSEAAPALLKTLQRLQHQIDQLRVDIPDLDHHIANRKQTFSVHEEISDAMAAAPAQSISSMSAPPSSRPSAEIQAGTRTPQIPRHVREAPTTPSRSHSPRGRKENPATPLRGPSLAASPAPSRLAAQTLQDSPMPSRERSRGKSPLPPVKTTTAPSEASATGSEPEARADVPKGKEVRFRTKSGRTTVEVIRQPNSRKAEETNGPVTPNGDRPSEGATKEAASTVQAKASGTDGTTEEDATDGGEEEIVREASLNHILTNVVILQEFILEIVALMQIRAGLFQEVRFA